MHADRGFEPQNPLTRPAALGASSPSEPPTPYSPDPSNSTIALINSGCRAASAANCFFKMVPGAMLTWSTSQSTKTVRGC